jgi:type II secretory pathway pseudopilin PulG
MKTFILKKNSVWPAKPEQSGGFTLLEALMAVSILMVAVMAPMTIAQKGLSSAVYTKNQMIASYLTQDVLEYIINKRDKNAIIKTGWLTGLEACTYSAGNNQKSCDIDTVYSSGGNRDGNGHVLTPAGGNLYRDNDGFYTHTNSNGFIQTGFTREVSIHQSPNNDNVDEALITVTVRWGGSDNQVTVNTLIYNY